MARGLRVVVVVHSDRGANRALADAVVEGLRASPGVEAERMDLPEVDWDRLAAADGIVFGCPTYMGSASGVMKTFLDQSSSRAWSAGAWRDKIAAGFTGSASPSGDKLLTLQQLAVFAAQQGMVWVGLDAWPGELNRLGSHLGAMAWTPIGRPPAEADLASARQLGRRVGRAVVRWTGSPPAGIHPTARDWVLPRPDRGPGRLERVNLRALMARPERLEHHLTVVARIGGAQLELVTASEPLAFAHLNRTDEYAVSLPTGDPLLAAVPLLTLLSDPATGEDVGRIRHREGDLVLHPHGLLHWPGRLRPPYEPFRFPPGSRRCGLSLVLCGCDEIGPGERPIGVRPDDVKRYVPSEVPFGLVDLLTAPPGPVAEVAGAMWSVVTGEVRPPVGGWLLVLEGEEPGDLIRIPAGESASVVRGLLLASPVRGPDPPPPSWDQVPVPPFALAEDQPPGALPLQIGELRIDPIDDRSIRVSIGEGSAEIPRLWAARMLFRIALHGLRLGYLETYGGLRWDDRGGYRLGLRGIGWIPLDPREAGTTIERLYRAIAPPGYTERPPA